jgi:hypothetical protein
MGSAASRSTGRLSASLAPTTTSIYMMYRSRFRAACEFGARRGNGIQVINKDVAVEQRSYHSERSF